MTNVTQDDCSSTNSRWEIEREGNKAQIKQVATGMCLSLDMANGGTANNENIQLWACETQKVDSQVWQLDSAY